MARPLRIELAGGRYHVTARGNERRNIFRTDRDRTHFLELVAELPDRFGGRLHAYAMMPNHYHLLLETPEPNLSRAIQWLNVSYSVWFNRRYDRSGHLFAGRFHAVLIEDDGGFQAV
ncbi:MAG: transposase, partial [Verrucomicrobia bacterium]|nr:transposase [Verrucomicrobiota bacterium]